MPFYPQFENTAGHIPDDVCIPEWIFANRPAGAAETAFIDSSTGQKRSWKQVEQLTRQLSRGLAKHFRVNVGDTNVFGLFAPNVRLSLWEARKREADASRLWKCRVPFGPHTSWEAP